MFLRDDVTWLSLLTRTRDWCTVCSSRKMKSTVHHRQFPESKDKARAIILIHRRCRRDWMIIFTSCLCSYAYHESLLRTLVHRYTVRLYTLGPIYLIALKSEKEYYGVLVTETSGSSYTNCLILIFKY